METVSSDFNPLHREGGDGFVSGHCVKANRISIHSTARVETKDRAVMSDGLLDFNPLHREGGDDLKSVFPNEVFHFNPLHREGGDSSRCFPCRTTIDFNPLHREGGDG